MEFNYKKLTIDQENFEIKYLTKIENYELDVSGGKISISVFYYPKNVMDMNEAEKKLEQNLDSLITEIKNIIKNNNDFYSQFRIAPKFTSFGSNGGKYLDQSKAINASASIYLQKI